MSQKGKQHSREAEQHTGRLENGNGTVGVEGDREPAWLGSGWVAAQGKVESWLSHLEAEN